MSTLALSAYPSIDARTSSIADRVCMILALDRQRHGWGTMELLTRKKVGLLAM
jgi:hypothetical protein